MTTPQSSIEERMARLEGSYEQIDQRLGALEQDVRGRANLNAWVDGMDGGFAQIDSRFDRIDSHIDRLFYWQWSLMGAIAASIITTILTRFL